MSSLALKGATLDTCRGKRTMRDCSNQLDVPSYVGEVWDSPNYPFPIYKPDTMIVVEGHDVWTPTCEAVEKLLSVEAPPRAQYIRVILTELCRIASHQVWLGTHALDIGAITPLFYCFRDREEVLKIFEKYCGARLTTHAFRIGGCLYEAYEGFEQDCHKFCEDFLPKLDEYEELLTTNR